jgi:hypothetical protein
VAAAPTRLENGVHEITTRAEVGRAEEQVHRQPPSRSVSKA